ncbi:hypothetical protein IFM89_026778 [Coptis chinensis]|uniref:Uncharacterized protein n=1 Tax=Coptis chinensis TaxID=261450 RepID=A0A835LWU1_9MAGN|nr:hypothetical protein IFM89_026778 [Coptis chinensis]
MACLSGLNNGKFIKYMSVGLLLPNMQAEVVNWNSGSCMPPGNIGELWYNTYKLDEDLISTGSLQKLSSEDSSFIDLMVRGKGRGNQSPVQRWVDGNRNFWEQPIPRNARQENRVGLYLLLLLLLLIEVFVGQTVTLTVRQAGRLLGQLIVMGAGIFGRAVFKAYRQALSNASKSGVAQETIHNTVRRGIKPMTEQEAREILGITESSSWEEILQVVYSVFEYISICYSE